MRRGRQLFRPNLVDAKQRTVSSLITSPVSRSVAASRSVWTLSPLVEEAFKVSLWRCERFFAFNGDKEKSAQHASPESPDTLEMRKKSGRKEALIVVNGCLPLDYKLLACWNTATVRICADGGSNRLYNIDKERFIPDHIVGDLDSANNEVLEHYRKKGVAVIHDSDQNTTDLQKALHLLKKIETLPHGVFDTVTILGGLGGDFSHEMANVNGLFHLTGKKAFLVSPHNIAFLLQKGKHMIRIAKRTKLPTTKQMEDDEEAHAESIDDTWSPPKAVVCGLIPIGEKCTNVMTKGLRWDIQQNQALEFGGLVSTSNEFLHNVAEVEVSHPVLWTFDFRDQKV